MRALGVAGCGCLHGLLWQCDVLQLVRFVLLDAFVWCPLELVRSRHLQASDAPLQDSNSLRVLRVNAEGPCGDSKAHGRMWRRPSSQEAQQRLGVAEAQRKVWHRSRMQNTEHELQQLIAPALRRCGACASWLGCVHRMCEGQLLPFGFGPWSRPVGGGHPFMSCYMIFAGHR